MVVNRILQWYRSGINPQDRLPFLATYLGHRDITSTLVYITVTQDLLQEAAAKTVPTLGSKTVTPHSFRHATAVHPVSAGVDVTVIRSWLGHVSLDSRSRGPARLEMGSDCGNKVAERARLFLGSGPDRPHVLGAGLFRARRPRRTPTLIEEATMLKKFALMAPVAALLAATPVLAADPPDPALAQFRQAYTTGAGLAYVVVQDDKGERIYRYGDASRQAAQKDTRGYMLFTCASPHVFLVQNPPDKAALLKAKVVKSGESGFAELDTKYLAGCKNPLVKSAVPKGK